MRRLSIRTRSRSTNRSAEVTWFDIDDKPDSARKLRRGARIRGRRAGRAAAFGHPQAERMQDLPGRVMLEKAVRKRQNYASAWVADRKQSLKARIAELPGLTSAAASTAKAAKDTTAHTKVELGGLPADHSPRAIGYLFVLGLLILAEYPTLQSALRVFPFGPGTRQALSYILSGVLAVAAHYLAKRIRVVLDSRDADRRTRRFEAFFVIVFALVIVALMTAMSVTRGDAFNQLATLTGGAFGDPALLTALMLTVQVTLFVIALAVGLQHAEGDNRRQLTKQLKRDEREARSTKTHHEALIAEKAADQEELKNMSETERLWIAREDELLGELLAGHDHAYESTEHSVWTRLFARVIVPRLGTARA
jgi:uncharacterized membrane protein